MKKRGFKDYALITLKGLTIGAADIIPGGISGGTIAFITGVYDELLNSIKNIDLKAFKLLFTGKFREFWKKVNGNFLLALLAGIGVAIFSLAKTMMYLIETFPIPMWSLFFGLIIASSVLVSRDITRWNVKNIVLFIIGALIAYFITELSPTSTPETWWFIILTGAIAICAMILPGIAGAFILLLMGKYEFLMNAVSNLQMDVILLFLLGAILGIISFSHVLSWLLDKYRDVTTALLTGFIVGSLNKIWPWKKVLTTYTDSSGAVLPLNEKNIFPHTFETLTGQDPQILMAIVMCLAGILLIYVLNRLSKAAASRKQNKI